MYEEGSRLCAAARDCAPFLQLLYESPMHQSTGKHSRNILNADKIFAIWMISPGIVYLMIFNIARKAGQIDKTMEKSRTRSQVVNTVSSPEDVSADASTSEFCFFSSLWPSGIKSGCKVKLTPSPQQKRDSLTEKNNWYNAQVAPIPEGLYFPWTHDCIKTFVVAESYLTTFLPKFMFR